MKLDSEIPPESWAIEVPESAKVGSIVLVRWDVARSHARGTIPLDERPQEARIIGINGNTVTLRFVYIPEAGYQGDMDEQFDIDLATGIDSKFDGVVLDIETRSRIKGKQR